MHHDHLFGQTMQRFPAPLTSNQVRLFVVVGLGLLGQDTSVSQSLSKLVDMTAVNSFDALLESCHKISSNSSQRARTLSRCVQSP